MFSSKICLIGAFAVGKTSLVKQFVESIFDEKYHTTIGVKIDKKILNLENEEIQMMIWDIEGVDMFTSLKPSYLRGADGIIIVIDGTRPDTLKAVEEIKKQLSEQLNSVSLLLLINKADKIDEWKISENEVDALALPHLKAFRTSAKTGLNVDEAFLFLAQNIMNSKKQPHKETQPQVQSDPK